MAKVDIPLSTYTDVIQQQLRHQQLCGVREGKRVHEDPPELVRLRQRPSCYVRRADAMKLIVLETGLT